MHTLILTPVETSLFAKVDTAMREGWDVQSEELTFDDSPEKFHLRLALIRLHDPALVAFRDRVKTMTKPEEIAAEMQKIAPELLLHDDLAALFFAMGPGMLSMMIELLLQEIENDTDLLRLAALTFVRHEILSSYHPAS